MMKIEAIVRPARVDAVRDALDHLALPGMTVTEVRELGRQKGLTATVRGKEYDVGLRPRIKIELVLVDHMVDAAVDAIMEAARTGEAGDGRVFVLPVRQSYEIRTGEADAV